MFDDLDDLNDFDEVDDPNEIDIGELRSWQLAVDLIKHIYDITELWPEDDPSGLVADLRGRAIRVSGTIANGSGRGNAWDFKRLLGSARYMLRDLETLLILAHDLGRLDSLTQDELLREIEAVRAAIDELVAELALKTGRSNGYPPYDPSLDQFSRS